MEVSLTKDEDFPRMSEPYVIACLRIYGAAPTESLVGWCGRCGHDIWIAKSTPQIKNAQYICLNCVNWSEVDDIEAPTPEQIEDVLRHRKRQ
jgi:hypothetical protein